jgi:sugar/nucleoside kinase (ribokinase family)
MLRAPQYFTAGGLRVDYLITPHQQVHLRQIGGNAVYSAVGARIWADQVGILSRVGDNYPREWLNRLERAGIGTQGVRRVAGRHDMRTFYAYLDLETRVDSDPARHFAALGKSLPADLLGYVDSTPGQDVQHFTPLAVRPSDLPTSYLGARAAHLCPQGWVSHRTLARACAQLGMWVSLDPGERYVRTELADQVVSLLRWVDAFLPSEREVELLMGQGDHWKAACRFAEAGPSVVVIKAGSKGSLVYDHRARKCWMAPAYPTDVVDVTGAGDAYCGGFMVGYAETQDAMVAGCYGAVSASFVLEGHGALHALRHSRADAEERLAALKEMVALV